MATLFLVCAAVGGILLVAGLVLAAIGFDHDVHGDAHGGGHVAGSHGAHGGSSDGLQLFSVRASSAGLAFFGVGGLGARQLGAPVVVELLVALVAGLVAMALVAYAMRAMVRLEHDASVRVDRAIGQAGTVYIPIPAAHGGAGKVLVILQGRTVELQAVTNESEPLPTGAAVVVVDVRDGDTALVVRLPTIDGVP